MIGQIEYIPLAEIEPADRNAKDHDIGALIQSIKRFGFVAPLIRNDATGKIVVGHGRAEAVGEMLLNGDPKPDGIVADESERWCLPVLTGISFRSDIEAEAYLIADNRLTELGGWDEAELVDVLQDLIRDGGLDGTGYDGEDLGAMLDRLGQADDIDLEDPGPSESAPVTCPECGHQF